MNVKYCSWLSVDYISTILDQSIAAGVKFDIMKAVHKLANMSLHAQLFHWLVRIIPHYGKELVQVSMTAVTSALKG